MREPVVFLLDQLNFGGSQKRAVNLARSLDPKRFDVQIVCLFDGGPLESSIEEAGLPLTIIGFDPQPRTPRNIPRLLELSRLLRERKIKVLHAFSYWCGVYGPIAGRLALVPIIITNRVCLYDLKPQGRIARWIERSTNPMVDSIVAISKAVRDDTIRSEGVPAGKVELVYNGVDLGTEIQKDEASSFRSALDLEVDDFAIAMVANFFPYKKHETLVKAAQIILGESPHVKFLLVGRLSGEYENLRAATERLGIAKAFRWLGVRDDIPALLAASNAGALCSASEAMSNSILEYMDAGLPVFASNVGGNPEMVVDGDTGWLFPVGDHVRLAERILELVNDPALAKRMGAAGRLRVRETFGLERMVEGYARVYEAQLESKKFR